MGSVREAFVSLFCRHSERKAVSDDSAVPGHLLHSPIQPQLSRNPQRRSAKTFEPSPVRMKNFDWAVEIVLHHEGGYVHDPADPGGETKFGISKRSYPHLDIKNLTRAQAREIYLRDYWGACQCSKLPAHLRLIVFDTAVNMGVRRSVRTLQRSVGAQVDGVMGPETTHLAASMSAPDVLIQYANRRMEFYVRLKSFDRFGKGWLRRLNSVLVLSLEG